MTPAGQASSRLTTCLTLAALLTEMAAIVGFVVWLHWATYRVTPGSYDGEIRINPTCQPCCSAYWWSGRWRSHCGTLSRPETREGRTVSVPADHWPELAGARAW